MADEAFPDTFSVSHKSELRFMKVVDGQLEDEELCFIHVLTDILSLSCTGASYFTLKLSALLFSSISVI